MKKDIEKKPKQDLSAKKMLWMSKKLKRDFEKTAKIETGKGNSFNAHARDVLQKEVERSKLAIKKKKRKKKKEKKKIK